MQLLGNGLGGKVELAIEYAMLQKRAPGILALLDGLAKCKRILLMPSSTGIVYILLM